MAVWGGTDSVPEQVESWFRALATDHAQGECARPVGSAGEDGFGDGGAVEGGVVDDTDSLSGE